MPRNQQSASNSSAQLSVRCDSDLKEQYKDALDDQGKSMSDDLREHMQRVVERHGGKTDDLLPSKPKLRKGLKVLADHAYRWDGNWLVKIGETKGDIKNEANISGRVKRQVFRPLENEGYITLGSTANAFEIDPEIVARFRDDVDEATVRNAENAEDECAICGNETDAEDLNITSEDHPQGANIVACPNCSTDETEVAAHGD